MKDSQRQKVYNSEFPVRQLKSVGTLENNAKVCEFVGEVIDNKKVVSMYGKQLSFKVAITFSRGNKWAYGGYLGIKIPNNMWAFNRMVILHELAHVIVRRTHYDKEVVGHGWEFCEILLNLTEFVLGKDVAQILKAEYKKNGVRFKPKTTREFSPEHREALRARMVSVRMQRTELKALANFANKDNL